MVDDNRIDQNQGKDQGFDSWFPNSPRIGGPPLPVDERTQREYFRNETMQIPARPSLTKYAPGRRLTCKVGLLPITLADELRVSFSSSFGTDYLLDVAWCKGVIKAFGIDDAFMKKFEELEDELAATRNVVKHRETFEKLRALILELNVGRGE